MDVPKTDHDNPLPSRPSLFPSESTVGSAHGGMFLEGRQTHQTPSSNANGDKKNTRCEEDGDEEDGKSVVKEESDGNKPGMNYLSSLGHGSLRSGRKVRRRAGSERKEKMKENVYIVCLCVCVCVSACVRACTCGVCVCFSACVRARAMCVCVSVRVGGECCVFVRVSLCVSAREVYDREEKRAI